MKSSRVYDPAGELLRSFAKLSGGQFSVDELYALLNSGLLSVWCLDKVYYSLLVEDGVLCVLSMVGEDALVNIEMLHSDWVEFAKEVGCKRIAFSGRKGWQKPAQQLNYKLVTIMMEYEV